MAQLKQFKENSIWLVEARKVDQKESVVVRSGSAVSVWLKNSDDSEKKYLLTCAHCICDESVSDNELFGKLLPELKVYRPGAAYKDTVALDAKLIRSELDLSQPTPKDVAPASDWVLIDVENADFSSAGDHSIFSNGEFELDNLAVIGYLQGSEGIDASTEVVTPYVREGFRIERTGFGDFKYTGGEETGPGMSGGGVFASNNRLIGLHRASIKDLDQARAIDIEHILSKLGQSSEANSSLEPATIPGRMLELFLGEEDDDVAELSEARNATSTVMEPREPNIKPLIAIVIGALMLVILAAGYFLNRPSSIQVFRVVPPLKLLHKLPESNYEAAPEPVKLRIIQNGNEIGVFPMRQGIIVFGNASRPDLENLYSSNSEKNEISLNEAWSELTSDWPRKVKYFSTPELRSGELQVEVILNESNKVIAKGSGSGTVTSGVFPVYFE